MITRGIIIGKIVDDLASLKSQVETRNKLGQFDLSKFCEDFFREVLNTTYKLNLINLNKSRSNSPGLDLGDERQKIAFQITSEKSSTKVNDTLKAIRPDQAKLFKTIYVFIVGEKQTSYTLDESLCKKYNFDKNKNIQDIDDLLREIVLLDIEKLEILYTLFQREFRQVKIELEVIDEKGNFESSYYNVLEKKPSSPPKNGIKFLGEPSPKGYKAAFKDLMELYSKLASVPRVTREVLAIIVDKGKYEPSWNFSRQYGILPQALEKFMRISQNELLTEINILEHAGLVTTEEGEVGERRTHYILISNQMLNDLFVWATEENEPIRTLLNTMDFTILDK